ncbi:MAG: carbohydrate porin [Nevskia sp.]|nr:carbohydrate porin [Nevskia sp.]
MKGEPRGCARVLLCLGVLLLSPAVRADGTLTGDWNGGRAALQQRGIDPVLGYGSEVAYNASGGDHSTARYTDQWVFGGGFDLQALFGLPAANARITLTDRNGRNLSDDAHLGTLQEVQEVYGRGQTLLLTQFWYRQSFAGGGADLKLGRMPAGEDFASFACDFENLSFCGSQPGDLYGNYWYNWPVSSWAARLKLQLGGDVDARLGIYQVDPAYVDTQWERHSGWKIENPGGTAGALIPLQLDWSPAFGAERLAGQYAAGLWYSTAPANDVLLDSGGQPAVLTGATPLVRHGSYGGYLDLQQALGGGVKGFLRAVQADRRTSTVDSQVTLGLVCTGFWRARPQDDAALALARSHVNGRVADGERLQDQLTPGTVAVQTSEYVGELYYSWHALPGLVLRPDLQYVLHPGGSSRNDDALVLGLKTQVAF